MKFENMETDVILDLKLVCSISQSWVEECIEKTKQNRGGQFGSLTDIKSYFPSIDLSISLLLVLIIDYHETIPMSLELYSNIEVFW